MLTDTFKIQDNQIVRGGGRDMVRLDDIASWSVTNEMTFDIVLLRLQNGNTVQWLDIHNDLLEILDSQIPDRRVGKGGNG